ncbi:MAG: 16S rRNA (adenine(1518)-N(6)/adenine(1519)-N(6))-dimethyltransferase RsmA [Pseudomonadota bacterium]
MTLEDLPPLRETIAQYGLAARKGLGQHFLLDLNLTRKIASFCEATKDDTILEVGPGPGGLTRALLDTGASVVALERDSRVMPVLHELAEATRRLTAIETDALHADETALGVPDGAIIASNLPYNISTELLVKWLITKPRFWKRMVLMFQREVGARLLAEPGSKTYGRLSVLTQTVTEPSLAFHLPARAFTPPPQVESSVLVFKPKEVSVDLDALQRVTKAAFAQRRKMLRQSLKPVFGERLKAVLAKEGIDETARAEDLSMDTYQRLATASL